MWWWWWWCWWWCWWWYFDYIWDSETSLGWWWREVGVEFWWVMLVISYLWSRKNLILDPAMALGWSYCAYLEATGSCTCYIAQLYISEYIFTIRLSWIMSLRNVGITGQSQIPVHGDKLFWDFLGVRSAAHRPRQKPRCGQLTICRSFSERVTRGFPHLWICFATFYPRG
jgi:hypothetical protein